MCFRNTLGKDQDYSIEKKRTIPFFVGGDASSATSERTADCHECVFCRVFASSMRVDSLCVTTQQGVNNVTVRYFTARLLWKVTTPSAELLRPSEPKNKRLAFTSFGRFSRSR